MKKLFALGLIIIYMCACASCGEDKVSHFVPDELESKEPTLSETAKEEYQFRYPVEGDLCADINFLDYGHVYVKLFREDAPYAVDNFVKKAKKGEYDGTLASTAVENYYVQAGKPINSDTKEESIWGGGFSNEISEKLMPFRGALCMANQGTADTNAMQFFLPLITTETINGLEQPLRSRYGMGLREYLKRNYATDLTEEQLTRFYTYGGAPWMYTHNTVFGQTFKGFSVLDNVCSAVASEEKTVYISKITIYEYVD